LYNYHDHWSDKLGPFYELSFARAKVVAFPIYYEIPVDALSKELGGRNRVISMMNQLKNNSRVYDRMIGDGYADDEIPLWVARPSDQRDEHTLGADDQPDEHTLGADDQPDEHTLGADELRSDTLDPDELRSDALRSALTPKRTTTTIPRYPGERARAESGLRE
jgi:hypothetical protein